MIPTSTSLFPQARPGGTTPPLTTRSRNGHRPDNEVCGHSVVPSHPLTHSLLFLPSQLEHYLNRAHWEKKASEQTGSFVPVAQAEEEVCLQHSSTCL